MLEIKEVFIYLDHILLLYFYPGKLWEYEIVSFDKHIVPSPEGHYSSRAAFEAGKRKIEKIVGYAPPPK
ncbi:MAG: hypothetical protein ACRDBG_06020 [Waterburya sp.]